MVRNIGQGTRSLTEEASTLRLCSLYELLPLLYAPIYLTNHQRAVVFNNRTYEPAGGLNGGAYTGATGFEDASTEIRGALTSDKITVDMLNRGLFRNATIVERVVDWRFPWAGAHMTHRYVIEDISYDGRNFVAQLHGIGALLSKKRGGYYSRPCPAVLGDSDCAIQNIAAHTVSNVAVVEVIDERTFRGDFVALGSGYDPSHFVWGKVEWAAGNNRFRVGTIGEYDDLTQTVKLIAPPMFDVVVGDRFHITAGCDGRRLTCQGKFNNLANFQGMGFVRGTNATLNSPRRNG